MQFIKSRPFFIIQMVAIIAAFSQLLTSDAYYVAYLFVLVPSLMCLHQNYQKIESSGCSTKKSDNWAVGIFGFLFACMVVFANYNLWDVGGVNKLILFLLFFFGSFFAFGNILCWIILHKDKIEWMTSEAWKPLSVFFISFAIIAVINLMVLFLCKYPGNLTPDSVSQMQQLTSNVYSNHHPFYHTLTIKLFVDLGLTLFHNINAAVALYSTFSILLMAAAFSFSVATVDELKVPKLIIVLLIMFYALMPYHIMYSMTMWKDIFFGGFVLLFVIFFFRCLKNMSMKPFNYVGLVVSGFAFCLYRSNGYFAFVFTTIAFLIFWKLKSKKILAIMLIVLAGSFILKHPVLKALNVTQPDLIESLSVPAQQIARDVIGNDDLSKEDVKLLSKVIDVDKIPETYNSNISDPIKELVREKNNQEYIKSHAGEFIDLYFHRAVKHPFTYLKGWIDETRGYWNAGYSYWRWANGVQENDLGIQRTINSERINTLVNNYFARFESWPCLQIFLCIGFFDWLMLGAFFVSIIRRDKVGAMLSIPTIMIVFSLLVATPVFAEFRYDYAVFCALPIVLVLVLRPEDLVHGKEAA